MAAPQVQERLGIPVSGRRDHRRHPCQRQLRRQAQQLPQPRLYRQAHQLREPRSWFSSDKPEQKEQKKDPDRSWWDGFSTGWFVGDADGVAIGCLVVVGLVVLAGLVWFLIEVAIPLVLFLLYFVTRGMLAQVVNDRHRCRGRLGRALAWGLVWATLYTTPVAAAVWYVHFFHQRSQIGV